MLRSIDVLIGLTVVMLTVSMVVTVLTEAINNLFERRGAHLLDGIAGLLRQMDSTLPEKICKDIATAVLTHPLIKSVGCKYGSVIHREELTSLLLEFAAGDGVVTLEQDAKAALIGLLKSNGINDPCRVMQNVRQFALILEQAHPELANNERYAVAFLQEASSSFLAKIHGWFDQTMDRVSDRFTANTRLVTFGFSLVVALFLQLDTVAVLNRLWVDPATRMALVQTAEQIDARQSGGGAAPATAGSTTQPANTVGTQPANAAGTPAGANNAAATQAANGQAGLVLSPETRQQLLDLDNLNLISIPTTWNGWANGWSPFLQTAPLKIVGIFVSALLLSLGAPFWYNALKNLLRLRSLIAGKDDDQRAARQTNTSGAASPTPILVTGEAGDLTQVG